MFHPLTSMEILDHPEGSGWSGLHGKWLLHEAFTPECSLRMWVVIEHCHSAQFSNALLYGILIIII